jgi:hypothetical protein
MDTKASIPASKEDLALTFEIPEQYLEVLQNPSFDGCFSFGFLT